MKKKSNIINHSYTLLIKYIIYTYNVKNELQIMYIIKNYYNSYKLIFFYNFIIFFICKLNKTITKCNTNC